MRKIALCAAALAATVATPALAGPNGTVTRTMDVVLNVTTSCTLTTPTTMDFGFLTSVTGSTSVTRTSQVTCTPGAAYTVKVDGGQNFDTIGNQRRLKAVSGTTTVNYNVLQSDGSTAWPTAGQAGTGSGAAQDVVMIGKLNQTSEVAAGEYRDVLTITLDY